MSTANYGPGGRGEIGIMPWAGGSGATLLPPDLDSTGYLTVSWPS